MTVVFDAEPLVAFAFDEPGADIVEEWLTSVYDGDPGYVSTITLAEVRYIAARNAAAEAADAHISRLREMGLTEYAVDDLWQAASTLKLDHAPSVGDAYAAAAAADLATEGEEVTLLVGADADWEAFEDDPDFAPQIERFRTEAA